MDASEFQQRLLDRLCVLCRSEVDPDTDLFKTRLLNSMKFIELMAFVETTLAIKVPTSQLSAEHFKTARTIVQTFCGGER